MHKPRAWSSSARWEASKMSATAKDYLPFRGLSAWFSTSVPASMSKQWDEYGGSFAKEVDAEYLFSDSAFAKDTKSIYSTQKDVCLFLSSWITDVIQQGCPVHDIPVGKYCLQPHYVIQEGPSGNLLATPMSVPPALPQRSVPRGHIASKKISPTGRRNKMVAASTSNQGAPLGSIGHSSRQAGDPTTGFMNGQTECGTGGPLIDSNELWCNVEEMRNTVKLEDIPHVYQLEISNVPFFDFVPQDPGFFLGRVI